MPPRCPRISERINKLRSIQTMECYSKGKAKKLKRNKLASPGKTTEAPLVQTRWHSREGKTMETFRVSGTARGVGGGEIWIRRIFRQGHYSVWHYNGVFTPWHISPRMTECTPPGVTPNVTYEFWVTVMGQCGFIGGDECAALVGNADKGEAVHGGRQHVQRKSLYLPLCFATNLKLL